MKRFFIGLLLSLCLVSFAFADGISVTFNWTNPPTRANGTALTAAEQAALVTNLYLRGDATQAWTYFGSSQPGATTWTGTVLVTPGATYQCNIDVTLNGATGAKMATPFSLTVPVPSLIGSPSALTGKM